VISIFTDGDLENIIEYFEALPPYLRRGECLEDEEAALVEEDEDGHPDPKPGSMERGEGNVGLDPELIAISMEMARLYIATGRSGVPDARPDPADSP